MKLNQADFRFTSAIQYTTRNARSVNALHKNNHAGVAPNFASFQYGRVIMERMIMSTAQPMNTKVILLFSLRFLKCVNMIDANTPPSTSPVSVPPKIAFGIYDIKLSCGI